MQQLKLLKNSSGLGLIELMVSMTIGLLILAGVIQVYLSASQNSRTVIGASAIQEHARLLFSRVENDVSRAGYAGCMNFNVEPRRVINIVNQQTNPAFNPDKFVDGKNDVQQNGKAFDEFTVSYAGNAGRLKVKEVSDTSFSINGDQSSTFNQGDLLVVGDCSSFGIFRVSNSPEDSGEIEFATGVYNTGPFSVRFLGENSPSPVVTYIYSGTGAFRYFVGTSAAGINAAASCSAATPEFCALFRKSSTSDTPDELFEGIASFEVEYGWRDSDTGNLFFANAANVPSANWSIIDRINISATLRSPEKMQTNEGSDYIERQYTRQFFLFNQSPEA